MASIWSAAAATPNKDHRLPADVSGAGVPTMYTVQQLADLATSVGTSHNALGSIGVNTAINLASGPYVSATITGNLTFTFTNPPASPSGCEWILVLTNGGAHTITWPGSVTWAGATAPTLTASGVDVLRFVTGNGGTNWYGWVERDEVYQAILVSGTNIKTINSTSLLGSGDIAISASPGGSSGQGQYNNAGALGGMPLWREDANTVTQRNSTSAQGFRVANTWTDSSNYELGVVRWNSNVLEVGTLAAGTGSAARTLKLLAGGGHVILTGFDANNSTFSGPGARIGFNVGTVVFGAKAEESYNGVFVTVAGMTWGRDGSTNVEIGMEGRSGDALATGTFTLKGRNAAASATTNITGGALAITAGNGASASAGNAHGGNITLTPGTGYGTGHGGYIILANLPAASAGLPTGALWNDAGTLKIA